MLESIYAFGWTTLYDTDAAMCIMNRLHHMRYVMHHIFFAPNKKQKYVLRHVFYAKPRSTSTAS